MIGLNAKNAILIVEFAKMKKDAGEETLNAAIDGAKLRFRPILMTSFAFILGVVPLLTASGAGAEGRKVMGMAVFAGMLTATIIGVLLIPAFYVLIEGKKKKAAKKIETDLPQQHNTHKSKMKAKQIYYLLLISLVLLSGCMVGKRYTQPEQPTGISIQGYCFYRHLSIDDMV